MRVWGSLIFVAFTCLGFGQTFATSDNYSRSASSIAKMGHDNWIKWYCDESRKGKNGRLEGEKVYCLALHEDTQAILKTLPQSDQQVYGGARSFFADLAKSAFGTGLSLTGYSEEWDLPIAESSTAVNEAIWQIVQKGKLPTAPTFQQVGNEITKIEEIVAQKKPNEIGEARRFRGIAKAIETHFKSRPDCERAHARIFMMKMSKLALLDPKVTPHG